jgi:hypothetical protein
MTVLRHDDDMTAIDATDPARDTRRRRWGTPTGDPCPRSVYLDGRVAGTGDCQGCGFCLLLAGLVDLPATLH